MTNLSIVINELLRDVLLFSEHASGIKLRSYQVEVARAVVKSVIEHQGLTFVVMFPRQSGKNELQAQIETYLLAIYSTLPAEIVKVSPTWKPQSLNAMRRLERTLKKNLITQPFWDKEAGYIYRVNNARIYFMSAQPTANIVGATANILLECDEAQDVQIAKWDKDEAPMAASTNATRVFWGTAWTSRTLLAREWRAAQQDELRDGIKRVFRITADEVGQEVPAYRSFVAGQIAKLGRSHPLIRTQFFSEEIDAESGMFPSERRAMMRGRHSPLTAPEPCKTYVMTLDLAGADEASPSAVGEGLGEESKRDATALTIAEIDFSPLQDPLINAPAYLVRHRKVWNNVKHSALYPQIKSLIELWQPRYIVIDATGIGAGLASFFSKAYPDRAIPFVFTGKSKSDLGWSFLALIDSGRYKEPLLPPGGEARGEAVYNDFWTQLEYCQSEILEGPGKLMRWGVPDGTRDPRTGRLIHDDLILSAALLATLDAQPWGLGISTAIHQSDLFAGMKDVF